MGGLKLWSLTVSQCLVIERLSRHVLLDKWSCMNSILWTADLFCNFNLGKGILTKGVTFLHLLFFQFSLSHLKSGKRNTSKPSNHRCSNFLKAQFAFSGGAWCCSPRASSRAGEQPHTGNTFRVESVFKSRASEVNTTPLTIMKVIMNFLFVSVLLC